jgi:hypothetical protein
MSVNPIYRTILAARQLGLGRLSLNALYRFASVFGIWKLLTPRQEIPLIPVHINDEILFPALPDYLLNFSMPPSEKASAISEADEIVKGMVRLFGGPPVSLNLIPGTGNSHWSNFDKSQFRGEDIKFTWEPARFGWAVRLARAYLISKNEAYPEAFWRHLETFIQNNPPNCGPNWSSAQEVAIRIIVFSAVYQAFKDSPYSTTTRKHYLARIIASHAHRIPPTLIYARAQDNNHLLLEAAGLYTAGVLLSGHPHASNWKQSGWKWFNYAVLNQVEPDGTYTQHSTNYHRLMLQTALWIHGLTKKVNQPLPSATLVRLSAAADWLEDLLDPISGRVPNLGNNDGAYILPFTAQDFSDYRPVLQAASIAFRHHPVFKHGIVDEFSHWMGLINPDLIQPAAVTHRSTTLKVGNSQCWATLRAVHFKLRPAHADQLQVDLWAFGENILRDAGTFQYNAAPPWNNPLSQTSVHNTIQLNESDQMLRAGRFLWLRPAQAKILLIRPDEVMAEHDGYQSAGWTHRRSLKYAEPDTFIMTDRLIPTREKNSPAIISLQWLLPDWPGELSETTLDMSCPFGKIALTVQPGSSPHPPVLETVQLVRAGELLAGSRPPLPFQGWFAPTYGIKTPAISFRLFFALQGDTTFITKLIIHQTLTSS